MNFLWKNCLFILDLLSLIDLNLNSLLKFLNLMFVLLNVLINKFLCFLNSSFLNSFLFLNLFGFLLLDLLLKDLNLRLLSFIECVCLNLDFTHFLFPFFDLKLKFFHLPFLFSSRFLFKFKFKLFDFILQCIFALFNLLNWSCFNLLGKLCKQ